MAGSLTPTALEARVTDLLEGLESGEAGVQAWAQDGIRRLGAEAVAPLVRIDRHARAAAARRTTLGVVGVLLGLVSLPVLLALVFMLEVHVGMLVMPLTVLAIFVVLGAMIAYGVRTAGAAERVHRRGALARQALELIDDPAAIAPLAEALRSEFLGGNPLRALRGGPLGASPALFQALARLLPRATQADWDAVAPEARQVLLGTLALSGARRGPDALWAWLPARDAGLALAVLAAVERYGGEDTLAAVRTMAESSGAWEGAGEVRAAARRCLAAVTERVSRAEQVARLVRPAGAVADTLVRPAAGSGADEAPNLVRPAASHDGDEAG